MRLAGFSLGYVVRTGLAAIVFILAFKWLSGKVPVPALQSVAASV